MAAMRASFWNQRWKKAPTPQLRRVILNMTAGQTSQIIKSPEGYRIIKVISKESAGQRLLTDPRVQEQIRSELFQGKQQMLRAAFYEVARSEAKITNYYAKAVLKIASNLAFGRTWHAPPCASSPAFALGSCIPEHTADTSTESHRG